MKINDLSPLVGQPYSVEREQVLIAPFDQGDGTNDEVVMVDRHARIIGTTDRYSMWDCYPYSDVVTWVMADLEVIDGRWVAKVWEDASGVALCLTDAEADMVFGDDGSVGEINFELGPVPDETAASKEADRRAARAIKLTEGEGERAILNKARALVTFHDAGLRLFRRWMIEGDIDNAGYEAACKQLIADADAAGCDPEDMARVSELINAELGEW